VSVQRSSGTLFSLAAKEFAERRQNAVRISRSASLQLSAINEARAEGHEGCRGAFRHWMAFRRQCSQVDDQATLVSL